MAVKALRLGMKNYIIANSLKIRELQMIERNVGPVSSLADRAIDFMDRDYCRPISAKDVTHGTDISYSHLDRLFRAEKGCPVEVWLNKLRTEKARIFQRDNNLEVKEKEVAT